MKIGWLWKDDDDTEWTFYETEPRRGWGRSIQIVYIEVKEGSPE